MERFLRLVLIIYSCFVLHFHANAFFTKIPDPFTQELVISTSSPTDTIPLKDRQGDFITDQQYNPFDIDPSEIKQTVEYDPATGNYIVTEMIGEEYYRMPTYMTFEEFVEWRSKQQDRFYFNDLAGVSSGKRRGSGKIDPFAKIDVSKSLIDRLFGGREIDIQPQGNIDLTFGYDYQKIDNQTIPIQQQIQHGFDFDMDIQLNLDGKIGEKLNIGFNYNTNATFDFDQKMKLAYDTEQFSEDDIIKTIEAGNVSLPLRSTLIQGSQSLFGFKTELQFGKLRITALASQQRSQQEEITIEDGGLVQKFEIRPDEYDENRHFFISHYNRDNFEGALRDLPRISSSFKAIRETVQVWITNDRQSNDDELRNIAAIADLGESNEDNFTNDMPTYAGIDPAFAMANQLTDANGEVLPDNSSNDLFEQLVNDPATRELKNASTNLSTIYNMQQSQDFEVLNARKLRPDEYTLNEDLGMISLNVRLRPNQVLAISYQYNYSYNGDKIYQVGELTEDVVGDNQVIYTKLLKSTTQSVSVKTWDLMMKNVYSLGAAQVSQENFKLDIFYENPADGTLIRFLPEPGFEERPLLSVFNLDRLTTVGDRGEDGIFDYVPGVTIIPRNGSIIFPVLEPFGSSLEELLGGNPNADDYTFPELYNNTIIFAREILHKNRFVIQGEYKAGITSEISLGSWNIPQGSETVRVGSQVLQRDVDYRIDYGIGRVKILNEAYLQQGVPIRITFEDNSIFSLQQKTMIGLRADYAVNKNLAIGGTYLHLFERPFTEKVNLGDDPINNRIYGIDMTYSKESPWLTRAVDKLPFFSTKETSSIDFSAEAAFLRPGHSGAINLNGQDDGGVVSIDDFEGAASEIPLGTQANQWVLSSTPTSNEFPEGLLANDLNYGVNRAKLNWYVIDRAARSTEDNADSYTRFIRQDELFPNSQIEDLFNAELFTFDMSFYPDERGPYNFDLPNGTPFSAGTICDGDQLKLRDPESRWGGIMRFINNNDFQATNVEFIEFWMLNPFMERRDGSGHESDEAGKLVFNLGNVSEDVLKDNLQFFENTIPTPNTTTQVTVEETTWGKVAQRTPTAQGFAQNEIEMQDLGFDGMTDAEERSKFEEFVTLTETTYPSCGAIGDDPANDNFVFFGNDEVFGDESNLLERYKEFNGPQGNAPGEERVNGLNQRGNPIPDKEDLNRNWSLDQGESYFEYEIPIANNGGEIDMTNSEFITETTTTVNPQTNAEEKWYRFRIPVQRGIPVNGIQDFRSIQFIRMYLNGFETSKTFRMAEFQFVRNQWRKLGQCSDDTDPQSLDFSIDKVTIENNSERTPFPYVLPRGIKRERINGNVTNVLQDERALSMRFRDIGNQCDPSVYKLTQIDLRVFERLQMFVHAESFQDIAPGELSIFLRIGKDFLNNYYEYEIPLTMSDINQLTGVEANDSEVVWLQDNMFDFPMKLLTDLKIERNVSNIPFTDIFSMEDPEKPGSFAKIVGNPSLGYIKGIQVGIRVNNEDQAARYTGEVWINELRAVGLDERGGMAATARLDVQMADLGNMTLSTNYSTIGFGALDQKLDLRSKEEIFEYDVATNLELGKFFPDKWGIKLPFYAQYAKSTKTPQFDPYDLDLTMPEKLATAQNPAEEQEFRERAEDVTTIKTVNFTNVRKERTGDRSKSPKPWDVENLSLSYSYSQIDHRDPILKKDQLNDYRGGIDYNYTRKATYIEPFKKLKPKFLRFIKEINFNPLPNAFSFNTQIRRIIGTKEYRLPETPLFEFEDRRFDWDRRYNLQWDLTRSLRLSFNALNSGVVDEYRKVGIGSNQFYVNPRGDTIGNVMDVTESQRKAYIRENFNNFGRTKNYTHSVDLTYTLPFKYLPGLDWISSKATYNSAYTWSAASLSVVDSIGNVIQNSQSRSLNATFSFDKLYNKSKYLAKIQKRNSTRSNRRTSRARNSRVDDKKNGKDGKDEKKKDREPSGIEKALIRPLLMLRDVRFSYREDLSTVVPGFTNDPSLFGLSSGFESPGWSFALGLQPDIDINNPNNWLQNAGRNGWIVTNRINNQQVLQRNTQNYELKMRLEPYRDFKIDINFKKTYRKDHSEEFKNISSDLVNPNFQQLALRDLGSFEVTYSALNTLFNDDVIGLFQTFESNRSIISARLPNITTDPHDVDGDPFTKGYGRESNAVLVPAFLAAYTGTDANTINLDLENEISQRGYFPRPNWNIKYDGLSKLPWFKDLFSNVSITHGYKSTLVVNAFNTDPKYEADNPFTLSELETSQNYHTRIDIPTIVISEQFSPIIGIDVKTKNDINLEFSYKRARNLELLALEPALKETKTTEFVFGFGFLIDDINIGFLTGQKKSKKRRNRRTKDDDADKDDPNSRNNRGGSANQGGAVTRNARTLQFNFDFSIRDDVTYDHKPDLIAGDPQRGMKSLRFSPSLDYDINQNLTMRVFYDFSQTTPYLSSSYPITNWQGGITLRFNLN